MKHTALFLLLLSCDSEPAPEPAPAPEPVAAPEPAVAPTVYSVQNIDTLQPVAPTREGRVTKPLSPNPQIQATLPRLAAIVDQYGGDPENPWAIGHGLVARGEGWKLTNGEDAIDWLFAHYAEEVSFGEHTLVRFPKSRGELRIEPHTELMLKMLTEIGVSPDRVVAVQGSPHPVADLYRGGLMANYLDPFKNHSSFQSTDDMAWALQAYATWSPTELVWVSAEGTPMSLRDFALFNGAVLRKEMEPIARAMSAGASFERQGQGIFQYTCGGAHLLQAVGYAQARGIGGDKMETVFKDQIDLAFYRLPRELAIYDAAVKRFPDQLDKLLVQRLKFTGHFVETMYKFNALGLFTPDEAQQKLLDGAAMQVALTTEALYSQGIVERLPQIRERDEQLYLDVIGDAAHALHGLRLGYGDDVVRY